ncbi:MAG: alkaline phosphatase family protein [Armatimonadetes bacterium]|nr:alkaline phosphatase family protein [Armatimonadota bacterium]
MKLRPRRLSSLLALLALPAAFFCAASVSSAQGRRGSETPKPKLVVLLVLDQFRADSLSRFEPFFVEGGFKWLMRNGAHLKNAHYTHATTYTGPGHATLSSGTYGHTSGIIGNRWYNRAANRTESMFFDPAASLLGGVTTAPKDDDTSPRNFIGNNISDQLLLSNSKLSKAIGISLKDRAAIMLAGKLGRAYWFHEAAGGFISSTYYMKELPEWVRAFNARKIPDSYYGRKWEKLLPETAYRISRADDFPYETDYKGLGRTFPHTLADKTGKPTTEYYEAFTATPFANDYELEFARLAIEREGLGTDEHPDLLGISITATDIAGHAYGPYSQETQDLVVRTDRQLADFFAYLNKRFRKGEWLTVFTADHGGTPMPEYMQSLGFDAGRIKKQQIREAIDAALNARFGPGQWIMELEDPGVFLNHDLIREKKLDPAEVQNEVGKAVLSVPGMARYFTHSQMRLGNLPPNPWAQMFEKTFFPQRSGDVLLMTKPFYFWGSYGEREAGSTHGSPYAYDTHVPLIFAGPGVRAGKYEFFADIADLAPTLAALLDINPPAGNEGRRLNEILAERR